MSGPKRILTIERSAAPYGAGKNMVEWVDAVSSSDGFHVDCILGEAGPLENDIADTAAHCYRMRLPARLNVYNKALFRLSVLGKMWAAIALVKYNCSVLWLWFSHSLKSRVVVVNNTRTYCYYLPFVVMLKLLGTRVIWRLQIDAPVPRWLRVLLVNLSDRVIVHGGPLVARRFFGADLPARKAFGWYNPIHLEKFDQTVAEYDQLSQESGVFRIICVALKEERKGIQHLIRAVGNLKGSSDIELIHIGGGIEGNDDFDDFLLRVIKESGVEDCVHMLGYRQDVPQQLKRSSVFVLVSSSETMPYVITEAMASKLPVIVSPVAGIPLMTVDQFNAFYVDYGDVERLTQALMRLRDDPSLRSGMGRRGRLLVERRFSLDLALVKFKCLLKAVSF